VAVYVGVPMWPYLNWTMCHMVADTEEELDEMAKKIGLRLAWKQGNEERKKGTVGALVHYDIAESKRRLAISNGAIALDTLEEEVDVLERLAEQDECA
jgi:hypothetical protein